MSKKYIDIMKEFEFKNYEKIIDYVDQVQKELIRLWQVKDSGELEHMCLLLRNILDFWIDSVEKKQIMDSSYKMWRFNWIIRNN